MGKIWHNKLSRAMLAIMKYTNFDVKDIKQFKYISFSGKGTFTEKMF